MLENIKKKDNLTDIVEEFSDNNDENKENNDNNLDLDDNQVINSNDGEIITLGWKEKFDKSLDKSIDKLAEILKNMKK